MGRRYLSGEDTTDAFRQKVTRKGSAAPSRWDVNPESQPYETTEFFGPYRTRNVGGDPWLNAADTWMKVEIQKLEAFIDNTPHEDGNSYSSYLEWVTEKEKVFIRDDS